MRLPYFLPVFLLFFLSACRTHGRTGPDLASMPAAWNERVPGGDTRCSDGSPYRFFVHPGDPARLLVHFEGGGACWQGENCDLHARPTYDPKVDERDNPGRRDGIFRRDHPANPFAAYTVVFVPYCTGDVHLGHRTTSYPVAATDSTVAHTVTIHHYGYVNARAALDWTFANVLAPDTIVVTGSSAGAIPSPVFASLLADQYPGARVVQLGDAAGGYRSGESAPAILDAWGVTEVLSTVPGFESLDARSFSYARLYILAAQRHPDVQFARYDTAEDEVQRQFLALAGEQVPSLMPLLEANREEIRSAVPNVRDFVAPGSVHTILSRAEFYTLETGTTLFRDWMEALVRGDPVSSVTCDPCRSPHPASD